MRYFFHVVGSSRLYPDELGHSLRTLEAARRHARALAEDLKKSGGFCGSCYVRVADERGNTLFEFPVSFQ
jgi:hypothetical protein